MPGLLGAPCEERTLRDERCDRDCWQPPRVACRVHTAAMDRGYDYQDVYIRCASYGVLPIVAQRRNSGTGDGPISRGSDRFKNLYRRRASVEREFGRLKHHMALSPLRVRGLRKVQLHANLCLITRLAGAL